MKKLLALSLVGLSLSGVMAYSTEVSAGQKSQEDAQVAAAMDARLHELLQKLAARQAAGNNR